MPRVIEFAALWALVVGGFTDVGFNDIDMAWWAAFLAAAWTVKLFSVWLYRLYRRWSRK